MNGTIQPPLGFPRGKAKGAVAGASSIQRSALFHPQMGGCAARVAKLATPTGRGGSYWLAVTNALHPLSQPVRAASSPKGGAKGTSCQRVAKLATPTGVCQCATDFLYSGAANGRLFSFCHWCIFVNVKYEQKMTFFRQITPGGIC